jgi:hypothetical protein
LQAELINLGLIEAMLRLEKAMVIFSTAVRECAREGGKISNRRHS